MKTIKRKLLILSLIFSFIVTSGFGCKLVDKKTQEAMKPLTLTYWRVYDGPDDFAEILSAYKTLHLSLPLVTVNCVIANMSASL